MLTDNTPWELENEIPNTPYASGTAHKITTAACMAFGFIAIVWMAL